MKVVELAIDSVMTNKVNLRVYKMEWKIYAKDKQQQNLLEKWILLLLSTQPFVPDNTHNLISNLLQFMIHK